MQHRNASIVKGLVAGTLAGLMGTVVMTQFQNGWAAAAKAIKPDSEGKPDEGDKEDSTAKVAGALANVAGRDLSKEEKKKAGLFVHYAFGTLMGTAMGVIAELLPRDFENQSFLTGVGFGTALFIGADEVALPLLGLAGKPQDNPLSSHFYGLASHLVYGGTTGLIRGVVRNNI